MRKGLEDILAEKDNLDAIFNSLTDGVLTHDKEMIITNFNRAAELITGFNKEEVVGKKCEDLFKVKLCGENCSLCQSFSSQAGLKEHEIKIQRKDGDFRWILLNTTLLRDKRGDIKGAVAILRDITEVLSLRRELNYRYSFDNIISKNHKMQSTYKLIEDVADTDATVLIQGETGTGKELVARAIHHHSHRAKGRFVKVDCSALSENLLESELFGHVKGAFTGAYRDKMGRFELAHKGTIFLDEIANLSTNLQIKLLRVLQDREIERVGDVNTIKVDVRVIAATNSNLKELMLQGKFREDLYYRLNVVPIFLPPLRERKEDIPLLVEHFIEKLNQEAEKKIYGISQKALGILMDYNWRGNVRELENVIAYAFVKCKGRYIQPDHLPMEIIQFETAPNIKSIPKRQNISLEAITRVLKEAGWNKSKAARKLGIDRTTLWRKIKEYQIQEP